MRALYSKLIIGLFDLLATTVQILVLNGLQPVGKFIVTVI